MRILLSESNLFKSAGLSAILTVMSVGRLVQAGRPLGMYIPMTFVAMMLASGPVTAWGRHAGMPGIEALGLIPRDFSSRYIPHALGAGLLAFVLL